MKPGSIAMIAAIAGLVVLVLSLVVYGVMHHSEPELMDARPGFTAADVPIAVCVSMYGGAPDDNRAAFDAVVDVVGTINERLGLTVLVVSNVPTCQVRVVVGAPVEAGWRDPGGDATYTPGSRRCEVETRNEGDTTMRALVLQHELGHCLGLAHDCWSGSIMCGGACCTLAEPQGFPPRIDDADRLVLRGLYRR